MQKTPVFTDRNEGFSCVNCGLTIPAAPRTCRNHCTHCLHSLHVDIQPGDRQNNCKGVMIPIGYETDSRKGIVLHFRCARCGHTARNKVAPDDDYDAILRITPPVK